MFAIAAALILSVLSPAGDGIPSAEELAEISVADVAAFESGVMSIDIPPFPVGIRFINGLSACNAHWETRYGVEQFGHRVESTCYGLLDLGNAVLTEDWPEGNIELVAVVYASLEHLPDGNIQMWDIKIFVNDTRQAGDVQYPSIILED